MKTRSRWLAAGVLAACVAIAAALWPRVLPTPARDAAPLPQRQAVAVFGFKSLSANADVAWLSTALSEMMTIELGAGDRLRAIPGEVVAQARIDLSLPEGGFDAEALGRIHSTLGADWVVSGAYLADDKGDGGLRLDLRLHDARDGQELLAFSEVGREADLLDLITRSGTRLRQNLGVASVADKRASLPANPEAARLYSEGLARLRLFDAQAARALLERAVAKDASSPVAFSTLAAAWSVLGYDAKAAEAARHAFELAADLPLSERLPIEARYRDAAREWDRSAEIYRTLFSIAPDNLEYGLALAAAETAAGHARDAQATIDRLRALPEPTNGDPRIDIEEAQAALLQGELERARQASQAAVAKAQARGARLVVAQARLVESDAWRRLGDLVKALAACEEGRRLYAEAGDRGGVARALGQAAGALWYQGDKEQARKTAEAALVVSREIGDKGGAGRALNTLAGLLSDQGRLAEARRIYEETLAIATEIGDKDREAVAVNNLGIALWKQGHLVLARKAFDEAVALANGIGNKRRAAFSIYYIGEVLFDQGQLAAARQRYQEALAVAHETNLPSFLADASAGLGKVAYEEGDPAEARRKYEESLAIKRKRGESSFAARNMLALAIVALDQGRLAEAEKAVREAGETFRKDHSDHLLGLSEALLSRALLAQGNTSEAGRLAAEATALVKDSEYRSVRLLVTIVAARVRAACGERDGALRDLEAAAYETNRAGLAQLELEAGLARCEIEATAPTPETRDRLQSLHREADERGFKRIAAKAGRL